MTFVTGNTHGLWLWVATSTDISSNCWFSRYLSFIPSYPHPSCSEPIISILLSILWTALCKAAVFPLFVGICRTCVLSHDRKHIFMINTDGYRDCQTVVFSTSYAVYFFGWWGRCLRSEKDHFHLKVCGKALFPFPPPFVDDQKPIQHHKVNRKDWSTPSPIIPPPARLLDCDLNVSWKRESSELSVWCFSTATVFCSCDQQWRCIFLQISSNSALSSVRPVGIGSYWLRYAQIITGSWSSLNLSFSRISVICFVVSVQAERRSMKCRGCQWDVDVASMRAQSFVFVAPLPVLELQVSMILSSVVRFPIQSMRILCVELYLVGEPRCVGSVVSSPTAASSVL